jgi:hypothetical protein
MPANAAGEVTRSVVHNRDHEILLADDEPVGLCASERVPPVERGCRLESEPRVERRIAEKDHRGLAARPCLIEHGSHECRADPFALAGWHHADGAECENCVLADPRAAELDVPDEITIVVGDKGERPIVIAQSLDDGCLLGAKASRSISRDRSRSASSSARISTLTGRRWSRSPLLRAS